MTESEILECPHGARCGGCAFLGVPYSEQLTRKHAFVQRGMARYPQLTQVKLDPVAGALPTQAYRAARQARVRPRRRARTVRA